MANKTLSQKKDAQYTILSAEAIEKSLQKQKALVENLCKKPLLFFRKYVGVRGRITIADFARKSYISSPTVKRYSSSSKRLIAESRTRLAYGLMLYWPQLVDYAFADLQSELRMKKYVQEIELVPTVQELKDMARKYLWNEYHAAFHEDAEIALALSENKGDLVKILYHYRYPENN